MNYERKITDWLPITADEVKRRGWNVVDIIIVSGDAYIDHPSFGTAVIARVLEHQGYKVAIIPQPNWRDDLRDFKKFGKPRLFFGVTSGCMDSMVNHYTANKRLRSNDAYTPANEAGFRPDYATIIYSDILKNIYPETPVVIGGIEASMRRFTHYDYWSDSLKPSILIDSKADLLVYGNGEKSIIEIAQAINNGEEIKSIKHVCQTAYLTDILPDSDYVSLDSHEQCIKDKKSYASNFAKIETEASKINSRVIIQENGNQFLHVNPMYSTVSTPELDSFYDLPYTRLPHPKYNKRGVVPAYEMIRHSINIHRGCFGGCSFCTITVHQGKQIQSRSEESILNELKVVTEMPDFKGVITDLGGPSANMYKMKGEDTEQCKKCSRPSCIFPAICRNLNYNHKPLLDLYKKALQNKNIKHVFIGSGVRYDMLIQADTLTRKKYFIEEYTQQLITKHVSGRLKVAPEHSSDEVLKIMRKPSFQLFEQFRKEFQKLCSNNGLKYQLIPYFISSHPGCKLEDMAQLAIDTKDSGFQLEQVQDFTPTPMTLATVMYYTGLNPYTMKPVFTAKNKEEKLEQNRFFFWYKPENKDWIIKTLNKINRKDLLTRFYNPKSARNL
ncbi:MAG: YgiQ family radical SAM protein [Bacteroidota bacterium]